MCVLVLFLSFAELKMRAEAAPGNQQPVRLGTAASKNTWDCTIS